MSLLHNLADARALVASAVQRDQHLLDELAAEMTDRRHKADVLLRQVLAEVADGIRSAAPRRASCASRHDSHGYPAPAGITARPTQS